MNKKIAILASLDLSYPGGLENMIKQVVPVYAKHAVNHELFVPFSNLKKRYFKNSQVNFFPPGFCSLNIKKTPIVSKVVAKFFERIISKRKFSAMHIHCAYPLGVVFGSVARDVSCPKILHCHAVDIQTHNDIQYGVCRSKDIENRIKESLPAYSHFIAANANIKNKLMQMNVPENKISIVYNGFSESRLDFNVDRESVRKSLGIHDSETVLLVSAGLNRPVKGYKFAIESLSLLKNENVKFKYLILGGNSQKLFHLCQEYGLESDVILDETSRDTAMIERLKCADIYLLPSYIEGFPLIKAEAMSAGLPVLTTNAPGCYDFIENGINGIIVPKRDTRLFSDAIKNLIQSPGSLKSMSIKAKRDSKKLTWDSVVKQYMEIYNKVCND